MGCQPGVCRWPLSNVPPGFCVGMYGLTTTITNNRYTDQSVSSALPNPFSCEVKKKCLNQSVPQWHDSTFYAMLLCVFFY